MPPLYDDIGNAYELICDGASHTVDVDNTGATYETNEATYGEGEESCWLKLDLSRHEAISGVDCDFAVALVSGTAVPWIDIYTVKDVTFDASSPDFSKLDIISGTGGVGWLYGDGSSMTTNLGIQGSAVTHPAAANRGSGIYYIFVGDGDFAGGQGVQRITYTIPPAPLPLARLGASHRAAVATEATGQMTPTPVLIYGGKIHHVFVQSNDIDFLYGGPFVQRFDDPSWTDISGDLKTDATKWVTYPTADTDGSGLYVAWYESVPGAGPSGPTYTPLSTGLWHCKKWDGASWAELGTGQKKNSDGRISAMSLVVYQDQPTVTWIEWDGSSQFDVYVQQWDGAAWADVGTLPLNTNGARGYNDGTPESPFVKAIVNGGELAVIWVDEETIVSTKHKNFINTIFYDGASWGTAAVLDSQDATIFNGAGVTVEIEGFTAMLDGSTIYFCGSRNGTGGINAGTIFTLPWDGSSYSAFPSSWSGNVATAPLEYASSAGGAVGAFGGDRFLAWPTLPSLPSARTSFPGNKVAYYLAYQVGGVWGTALRFLDAARDYSDSPMLTESESSALISVAWSDVTTQEWWFDVYRVGTAPVTPGPTLNLKFRAAD